MKNRFVGLHIDALGFWASLLCAVHCSLLPVIILFIPLFGLSFLNHSFFEYGMITISFCIASFSLVKSYLRQHENVKPLLIMTGGFILIGIAQFGEGFLFTDNCCTSSYFSIGIEPVLMTLGGVSIALSHYMNWKLKNNFTMQKTGGIQ